MSAPFAGPSFQDYGTPWYIVRALERERGRAFDLDVCAEAWSAKAKRFHDIVANGLLAAWARWTWCNPRYRQQALWLRRASFLARTEGIETTALVRASIDARYWLRLVAARAAVDFYIGRIPFIAPPEGLVLPATEKRPARTIAGGVPVPGTSFASALVWYGPNVKPGDVRYRDASTGELINLDRARELRAEAAAT